MRENLKIVQLNKEKFAEAVEVVIAAELDTREEIEGHLRHMDAHYVTLDKDKVVGLIGWYQDNVNYATEAMGDKFPGEEAYWVGFYAVDKKYRGGGIGYELMKKLVSVLKKMNVNKLWVASVPETRSYYERQGFRIFMEGKIRGKKRYFLVRSL